MNRTMTALEWALLIGLSVLWGTSFLFITMAREVPPLTVSAVRVTLAAGALLVLLWRQGVRLPRSGSTWWAFAVMALFNDAGPFLLLVLANPYVPTGLTSVLVATSPLFTVVLAHLLTDDERMTGRHVAGALTGFAGLAVMLGGGSIDFSPAAIMGQLACLAASLGYAYASVYGRRFTALRLHPMTTAAGQLGTSALVLVPLALLVEHPWTLPSPSWHAAAALLWLGLLTGALAYAIFFRILATAGATNVVLVTFMSPITAILLGIVLLGERLAGQQVAGMALIGVGIAVLDGRPLRAVLRRVRAG